MMTLVDENVIVTYNCFDVCVCLGRGQLMMRVAVRSLSGGAAPVAGPVKLLNPAPLGIYPRLLSRLFHENLLMF